MIMGMARALIAATRKPARNTSTTSTIRTLSTRLLTTSAIFFETLSGWSATFATRMSGGRMVWFAVASSPSTAAPRFVMFIPPFIVKERMMAGAENSGPP